MRLAPESWRCLVMSAGNTNLRDDLARLYGEPRADALLERFTDLVARYRCARPETLRQRDERLADDWFRDPRNAVYVLYADRFCPEAPRGQKLTALRESLPYFEELGVNILHILPILASTGDDGFAVSDYRKVDEALGTNQDCVALIEAAHARGLCITLDFVLNHVADEHEWARRAKANDRDCLDHFIWDESGSGQAWQGVRDVFSEFAPGHWDYVPELDRYVWATFYKRWPVDPGGRRDARGLHHPFAQWDLNYGNPEVLLGMIENLLFLANWGVDVFRLDAVPHIWKQRGTPCRNLPQGHAIIRLLRAALAAVAPRAVLLAEVNQRYQDVLGYFDQGRGVHIAYHFSLMPALWQAAIKGNDEALQRELARMASAQKATAATTAESPPCWWIFSECHDEVGLSTVDRETLEWLWEYFRQGNGGLPFKVESGSRLPRAVSGTTFSLLHGDLDKIVRLWELKLWASTLPECPGAPLFFMGEELGVENLPLEPSALQDTRFVKRVPLTQATKARRSREGTKEHLLFQRLRALLAGRTTTTAV